MAQQTGALLIRGDGWLAETRFANALLRGGTRVLWVQRAIDSTLNAGDLLVPLSPEFDAGLADAVDPAAIDVIAAKLGIELQPVAAGSVVATPLRALRIGLVNRVVPQAELKATAHELLGTMLRNGPVAVRAALEAIQRGIEMPLEEGLALEANIFGVVCATSDMREGMAAFLEKRKPNFKDC